MLRKYLGWIITIVIIFANPAFALNWSFIARNSDGSSHFIDTNSITINENSQEVTFKLMILVNQGGSRLNTKKVFTQDVINCDTKQHKIIGFSQEETELKLVDEPFAAIVPGSMIDKYYQFVCQ